MGMVTADAPRNVSSIPIQDPNDAEDYIGVDLEMVLIVCKYKCRPINCGHFVVVGWFCVLFIGVGFVARTHNILFCAI